MPTRTVTAASIGYVAGKLDNGRPDLRNAVRGETVELTDAEADRLDKLGATADPDEVEPFAEEGASLADLTDEELAALGADDVVDGLAALAGTVSADGDDVDLEARDRFVAQLERVDGIEAARDKRRVTVDRAIGGYREALEA